MVGGQDEKPISIKSAIVDIAYDYRKRENVFRLTTYNGSQYLFQVGFFLFEVIKLVFLVKQSNQPLNLKISHCPLSRIKVYALRLHVFRKMIGLL